MANLIDTNVMGQLNLTGNLYVGEGISMLGHDSNIGDIVEEGKDTGTTTLAKNTSTAVCSIDLTPGTWILIGRVRFAGTDGDYYVCNLNATSGNTDMYNRGVIYKTGSHQIYTSAIVTVDYGTDNDNSTTKTFYLNFRTVNNTCTVTGNGNCYGTGLEAIRIR